MNHKILFFIHFFCMMSSIPCEHIIGIDLGTTFLSAGVMIDGVVHVIPNELGNKRTPAYITFTDDGTLMIGEVSQGNANVYPKNTLYHIKRFIGRKFNDPFVRHAILSKHYPFSIYNEENKPHFKIEIKNKSFFFTPEELSAMFLKHMKMIAEEYIGEMVSQAVITIPSYFNEAQRQATLDAAEIAGLTVRRIINEPSTSLIRVQRPEEENESVDSAAALTSINQDQETEHLIVVLDIGGGTVDVSIIEYENFIHEVLATVGNTTLGGEDFNMRLYSLFMKEYAKRKKKPLSTSRYGHQLKRDVERAKIELSKHNEAYIEIISDAVKDKFTMVVTRQQFKSVCEDLIQSILDLVLEAVRLADVKRDEITDVLIVGGSSKIPAVRDMLYNLFIKKPTEFVNPDLAVVHGATIQASIIKKETVTNKILMIDVFPYTLGIETEDHKIVRIISKNTALPRVQKRELLPPQNSNSESSNPAVRIYRGDFESAKDNEYLGEFSLNEVPKNGKIVVRFEIDVNGVVKVSARYYMRVQDKWVTTDVGNETTLHKMESNEIQRKQKMVENFWQKRELYMRRKQNEATMELKVIK